MFNVFYTAHFWLCVYAADCMSTAVISDTDHESRMTIMCEVYYCIRENRK